MFAQAYLSKNLGSLRVMSTITLHLPATHLLKVDIWSDMHSVPSTLIPRFANQLVPAAWQLLSQLSSPEEYCFKIETAQTLISRSVWYGSTMFSSPF